MTIGFADPALAEALSVQQHPPTNGASMLRFGAIQRSAPLAPVGTREREGQLRQYAHNPYNTIFRGAVAGLVKRLQSTPWEIVAKDADRWQAILMEADFGSWDRFIAKLANDYLRHDSGAWVELIAPGDPRYAPTGAVVGIAALDSLRVYPTSNPTYPAIYYDIYGKMHLLHKSRVVQIVDNEDSEESLAGYGESALSRAIAPVRREILINKYVETFLDDKPAPGIMAISNLNPESFEAAVRRMKEQKDLDSGGDWGNTVLLYGLQAEVEPKITTYSNIRPPESFDFEKYKNELVREIALSMGLDIQDIWELSGGNIGSSTQSAILAQKSRGKLFGNLLKRLERTINQALPVSAEFRWQYRDPQEDVEEAEKAQAWSVFIQTNVASGVLRPEEARQVLVNQVPAMKDVLIDRDGNLRRLPDDDPKPVETQIAEDTDGSLNQMLQDYIEQPAKPADDSPAELLSAYASRAFTGTAREFERYFESFVRVGQAQSFSPAMMRATFRDELMQAGRQSYEDGLRAGGVNPTDADSTTLADRRRKVAEWLALQNGYINSFIDDVNSGRVSRDSASDRAAMWVNKSLRSIYYVGLNDAAGERYYTWKLGATVEHCKTCALLNGQTHKLKEWMRSGWMPKCSCLECKGFNCDCGFDLSTGPTRGRLPLGGTSASLADRFSGFLQRLAGKAVAPARPALPMVLNLDLMGRFAQRTAA